MHQGYIMKNYLIFQNIELCAFECELTFHQGWEELHTFLPFSTLQGNTISFAEQFVTE